MGLFTRKKIINVASVVYNMAGDEFKLKEVLVLATILAATSYFAFIYALKLQFPVWPSFLIG